MKGNVIIEPIEASNMRGGLFISSNQDQIPDTGIVISSAVDEIAPGMTVVYIKHRVMNLEIESKQYIVAKEDHLLAVLE